MRTPNLQYLYLQKPITMIVVICICCVLPWLGLANFSVTYEATNIANAEIVSKMLQSNSFWFPQSADGTIQHPLFYWLAVLFSMPQGFVSSFSFHLTGALSFIIMMAAILIFFGRRIKFHQAFIATLMLITCIGLQEIAIEHGKNILFATFVLIAIIRLYRWEETENLKGIPTMGSILLSLAALTGGLSGIFVPVLIFTLFLFSLKKYSTFTILRSISYVIVASIFIPILWYIPLWKEYPDQFFNTILIQPCTSIPNFITLFSYTLLEFMPWTLFFIISLFGIKRKDLKVLKEKIVELSSGSDPVLNFSNIMLLGFLFFATIFPEQQIGFIGLFTTFASLVLAKYALYITEYRTQCTRLFAGSLAFIIFLSLIAATLAIVDIHVLSYVSDLNQITHFRKYIDNAQILFGTPSISIIVLLICSYISFFIVCYQMLKKINIKILYSTIALMFFTNLLFCRILL